MFIAQWVFDLFIPIKEISDFSFHPPILIAIAITIAIFTFVHRNGPPPRNMFLILFNFLSLKKVRPFQKVSPLALMASKKRRLCLFFCSFLFSSGCMSWLIPCPHAPSARENR